MLSAKEVAQLRKAVEDGRTRQASLVQLAQGYELAQRGQLVGLSEELAIHIKERSPPVPLRMPIGTVFVGILIGILSNLITRKI